MSYNIITRYNATLPKLPFDIIDIICSYLSIQCAKCEIYSPTMNVYLIHNSEKFEQYTIQKNLNMV
jgi:hypothetical protein